MFPESFRATALLTAWLERLDEVGVELRFGLRWSGWGEHGPAFREADGTTTEVATDATVLALGGGSWARTGSDGVWADTFAAAGIEVAPLRPSNCGFTVAWTPYFVERHAGDPLKNVQLSFGGHTARGEAMLTDDGIEGNAVYALSSELRDSLDAGSPTVLLVDLRPDLTAGALTDRLGSRRPKESTSKWLRRTAGLPPVAVALLREACRDLPDDPAEMAGLIRACPVPLTGVQPVDRAISTAGGVAFDAVDEQFMLRARPGTFVAGEMLDWEAPTGGYLLQATFSTAVAAADGVRRWLGRD